MSGKAINPMDLMPWIALPYFADPTFAYFTLPTSGQAKLIAPRDPMRWGLIIAADGNFYTSPDAALAVSGKPGLPVKQPSQPFLFFTYPEFGPLVNCEWYAIASGPLVATVISINLRVEVTGDDLTQAMIDATAKKIHTAAEPPNTTPGRPGAFNPLAYWRKLMSSLKGGK